MNKVPYGVKVRVRGSEKTGFKAQICIRCNRFFPFLNIWTDITQHDSDGIKRETFDTFEQAKYQALKEYQTWVAFYERRQEQKKHTRKVANMTVWSIPNE